MESGISYRKRFLWQIADSELKSIQVAIKRRNLRNPIKTTAPLTRLFDPELHTLTVHLTGPNAGRENTGGLSIFDKPGVMCNKEATPDRTLEKERRAEESVSSDDSELASPRIYRKNSNPKCCRDLFLRDELMKKNSTKHNNKNRTSKERGNRSNSNKDRENRPSTSGYNKNRTELSRNDPRLRKSRSNTPRSTGSVDLPPNIYDTQRGHTESSRKEKQHNQRSHGVDQYNSGSSHSARYNKSSRQPQYTVHEDHQYHHQQQPPSPKQRSRRSRSISTRSRSVRSVSSTRHYRNSRETNTKYHRFKSRERNERSRSRSKSINDRRASRSKTTRRSRSRSLTPLRPGEYRPGKRKRLSRSRDDAASSQQRASQRNRMADSNMQANIIQPFDYPPMTMPYHQYGEYGAIFPGPRGGPMRYPSGGVPRAPHILAPPHPYAQYIQYVPVTALAPPPHARAGHLYPAHYQQPPRPNKVYNSRHIPQFQGSAAAGPAGETNSGGVNVNETVNDRFSVTANVDNESVSVQLEDGSDSLNHENPSSTSISTPVIAANLTPEQHVQTDDRLAETEAAEGITVEEP